MSYPYPSRREHHVSNSQPRAQADQGLRADVLTGRAARSARAQRRGRWVLGIGMVGLVMTVALVFFGYAGHVASQPPVLTVEGPLDVVSVAGRHGATPVVSTSAPVNLSSVKMRVETRGAGRELTADTPALIAVTAFDGEDATNLNETGTPNLLLGVPTEEDLGPLLSRLLIGQTEGSRLIVARPLNSGGAEIDVIDVLYTIASGTAVEAGDGPLTVTFDELGPAVSHAAADPPADLVIQLLNEGDGPQVQSDDTVFVQYVAGTWGDGRIISSTWAGGSPVTVDLAEAMPGLSSALIDQRVGTRLAATVPAEMATGEDTLFIVVDILGRMPRHDGDDASQNEEDR